MTTKTTRLPWTLLILAVLTAGCSQPGTPVPPLAPQVSSPTSPPAPPATVEFPPVTKPARIFGAPAPVWPYPLGSWTLASRFVLYDDGTFALQYGITGEYKGSYAELNNEIRFTFDAYRRELEIGAIGTLSDDTLKLRFDPYMSMSDFEDAVYTLVR